MQAGLHRQEIADCHCAFDIVKVAEGPIRKDVDYRCVDALDQPPVDRDADERRDNAFGGGMNNVHFMARIIWVRIDFGNDVAIANDGY